MQAISSKTETRRYWHSSSFKMALLFTVLLGLCVGLLGYFSYYFNRDNFISDAQKIIVTETSYLTAYPQALADKLRVSETQHERLYLLRDAEEKYIGGNLAIVPADLSVLKEGTLIFHKSDRVYVAKIHLFEDGRTLLIGMDITDATQSYRTMQWLSLLSIFLMAIVIGVSFLISTFVVSRTNRIAATAKTIMDTGDLSQRIVIDSRWDDLSNMTIVLNAFLERVERLMISIKQVSDNIAHDLKTPLTRLHNNLEQLRNHVSLQENPEFASLCDGLVVETGRLLDTFNALLRIARIEVDKQRQNFQDVEIDKIINDVADLYEPLAQDKNITLSRQIEPVPHMNADRDLLFQAFANILDNAVKFTPSGGRILVGIGMQGNQIAGYVQDNGPGIAENETAKVFERFYRADASRGSEGNGLGLALVAAVIALHNGEIRLTNAKPGLKFKIIL